MKMQSKKIISPLIFSAVAIFSFAVANFFVFANHDIAKAADFTITVDNNQATRNQQFVFQYNNIGPGFSSDAPIDIINNANSSAEVKLISIAPVNQAVSPVPPPANNLLPYVNLSLSRDGVEIANGTAADTTDLLGATFCVPALATDQLMTHFNLPTSVGNEAQNTSLWIRYTFQISVGPCDIVTTPTPTPPTPTPTPLPPGETPAPTPPGIVSPEPSEPPAPPLPPGTSETMFPFLVLGAAGGISLILIVIFAILIFLPFTFRRRDREGKKNNFRENNRSPRQSKFLAKFYTVKSPVIPSKRKRSSEIRETPSHSSKSNLAKTKSKTMPESIKPSRKNISQLFRENLILPSNKAPDFALTQKRRHRWQFILADIFLALCILIFAGAVFLTVQAKKSSQAVEVFGWRPYLIATGSMQPTLAVNGLVITHNDDFASIQVGDVVAFKAEGLSGQPALHRVIAKAGSGESAKLLVKGDNNKNPDGAFVTRESYLGVAKFHTNLTALYLQTLHSPGGWLKAIILPIVILILLYLAARFLISSRLTFRGKIIAFALVVFLVSTSIFASLWLYQTKSAAQINSSLAGVAAKFAKSDPSVKWQVSNEDILARLEIPSLNLDYPIVEYKTATTLNLTIAHLSGAQPNEAGNSILVGYRGLGEYSPFNLFFTNIYKLKPGDAIYLTDLSRTRVKYIVEKSGIISPDDKSILAAPDNNSAKILTLISASYDLRDRYFVQAAAK